MLQSIKNEQTLAILRRLKEQGPPKPTVIPLNMTLMEESPDSAENSEPSDTIDQMLGGRKKKRRTTPEPSSPEE